MDERLDTILVRLATLLGPVEGAPVALTGGITNRNYRVRFGSVDTVVRLCGKHTAALGIDRSTEALATARAAALGIGPDVLARLADDDVLVCAFLPGAAVAIDTVVEPLARALRAFHDSGPLPTVFDVFSLIERAPVDAELRATARRIAAAVRADGRVSCHNDLLAANVLSDPSTGVRIVDWEYSGMNHRCFDLGNLVANNGLDEAATQRLLAAYFRRGVTDRDRAIVALMQFVSDLREAVWGITQRDLSDLDFDYAGYAQAHFDRLRIRAADPRLEDWIACAATCA
jgi:Ser/Thr protein kinase RdoA (MazF antagonist)